MSEIQVNTSDLQNSSQSLKSASSKIANAQGKASSATASVSNVYDGQLRQSLEGIVGGSVQTGVRLQNRAVELGNELFIRANGFERANEAGVSAMLNLQNNPSTIASGGYLLEQGRLLGKPEIATATSLLAIAGLKSSLNIFNSLHNITNVLSDASTNQLKGWFTGGRIQKLVPQETYKDIGRSINSKLGPRAGYVGKLDRFGRKIQTKGVGKTLGVLGFGLGVLDDLGDGDRLDQALGSEAIELATDMVIGSIPVVGQVYLGYKIGMVGLRTSVGLLKLVGQKENAEWFDQILDKVDITERFGDVAYEAIHDFVIDPPDVSLAPEAENLAIQKYGFGLKS